MRFRFFIISFAVLFVLATGAFIFDRFVFYRNVYQQVDKQLETMAASILASELSLDLLNNFEEADDVIRDTLEDQRIDRTIRVFNHTGQMLFANEMGTHLDFPKNLERKSTVLYGERELRLLTVDTHDYIVEVGIFLQPLLTGVEVRIRNLGLLLFSTILFTSLVAYWISGLAMRPFVKLDRAFRVLKEMSLRTSDPSRIKDDQRRKALDRLSQKKDEVGRLAAELTSLFDHFHGLHENYRKDLFFLAHELKTPLAKIVLETESISDDIKDTVQKEALQNVQDFCKSMAHFIDDYLRVASMRSAMKNKTHFVALPLSKTTNDTIARFFENEISRINVMESTPGTIFAEPTHFQSLLVNLLQNALKYSQGQITVFIHQQVLQIEDTGPGLSTETEGRLGEAFNKSNNKDSTGLGLALVKSICDLYDWKLEYSRANSKTIFSIYFEPNEQEKDSAWNSMS